ncbi:hypothetical protein VTK26DRAFT_2650 [Humicola hyalothermophila]
MHLSAPDTGSKLNAPTKCGAWILYFNVVSSLATERLFFPFSRAHRGSATAYNKLELGKSLTPTPRQKGRSQAASILHSTGAYLQSAISPCPFNHSVAESRARERNKEKNDSGKSGRELGARAVSETRSLGLRKGLSALGWSEIGPLSGRCTAKYHVCTAAPPRVDSCHLQRACVHLPRGNKR